MSSPKACWKACLDSPRQPTAVPSSCFRVVLMELLKMATATVVCTTWTRASWHHHSCSVDSGGHRWVLNTPLCRAGVFKMYRWSVTFSKGFWLCREPPKQPGALSSSCWVGIIFNCFGVWEFGTSSLPELCIRVWILS